MAIYNNRVCKECGRTFSGGPRSWYCPECRAERLKAKDREYKRKGSERKLGNKDICKNCGKEYIINSGMQKYCPECQDKMHKELDNKQGIEYYNTRVDKVERAAKRRAKYQNKPYLNKTTGIRNICYVKSKGYYQVQVTYNKKRYPLKYSSDLDECKKILEEAERQIFKGNFENWYNELKGDKK
jgi:Zn finger protein HypA/HybF involved in hydrogenase expression